MAKKTEKTETDTEIKELTSDEKRKAWNEVIEKLKRGELSEAETLAALIDIVGDKSKVAEAVKAAGKDLLDDKRAPRYPMLTPQERAEYRRLVLKQQRRRNEVDKLRLDFNNYIMTIAEQHDYDGPADVGIADDNTIAPASEIRDGVVVEDGHDWPKATDAEISNIRDRQRQIVGLANGTGSMALDIEGWLLEKAEMLNYEGTFPIEVTDEGQLKPVPREQQRGSQVQRR